MDNLIRLTFALAALVAASAFLFHGLPAAQAEAPKSVVCMDGPVDNLLPTRRRDALQAWMTVQVEAGRTHFINAPYTIFEGNAGPHLCAW